MRTILLLLIALSCSAQISLDGPVAGSFSRKSAVSGGCSTSRDTIANGAFPAFQINDLSPVYGATWFTAGGTYTICSATLYMSSSQVGVNFTVQVGIYTDNSGVPGTLVGNFSDGTAGSSISTTMGPVSFANISASLTSGTKYWVVVKTSGTRNPGDGISWQNNNSFGSSDTVYQSDNGSIWTQFNNFNHTVYTLFSN